ncbi:hypothetical protein [Mesorhizobium sangaii]|uniref:Uncharacterized protein n=1 Tax=Mesorhizobium sangaii TaxID=505389 RepID=A0A841P704_9HYPH|nr:hypothetical protein [Mesorhizobium sangaii]MBB6410997.1 hypothetical protein [Mesorhizobium sangaii]
MIGIALHEFGDHFVIAAPNALSEQFQEKRETASVWNCVKQQGRAPSPADPPHLGIAAPYTKPISYSRPDLAAWRMAAPGQPVSLSLP